MSAQISPFSACFTCPKVGNIARRQRRPLLDGRLSDLGPHHLFCNTCLVRQTITELIARRRVRNAGGHASIAVRN